MRVRVESSMGDLAESFDWASARSREWVQTGKGPGYLPSYWAGLTDRPMFYSRDLAHQMLGAHLLGLDAENLAMLRHFAGSATRARRWYPLWAFHFDGTPAAIDYRSDDDFVREIPAPFELVEKAVEQYRWTGDKRFLGAPELASFLRTTMTQTVFAVIDSRRVRVEGLEFDFAVPTVVDATVVGAGVSAGRAFRLIRVPAVTLFSVEGRSVRWHGEVVDPGVVAWEGRDSLEYTQIHDPSRGRTRRGPNPLFDRVRSIGVVGDRDIRIDYDHDEAPTDAGLVYQMRATTRDHPGALVLDSSDVTLARLRFRYLHGFGVVAQTSRDVTVDGCTFQTPPETGRHTAGFADFVHFSGCSGRAVVRDCLFDGPHDDAVNVHGTYLKVAGQPDPRTLELEYVHPETAGFHQFSPGDQIEIIDQACLRTIVSRTVARVRQPSGRGHDHPLRTITLTVTSDVPEGLAGRAAVENTTRTPSVHIVRNVFRNVPTRGVLVTTPREILIEENRFERPGMAGVYVSGDAHEWWESGPVRSLTIRGNEFVEPGGPAVFVDPGSQGAHPVHSGLIVERNRFVLDDGPALDARNTRGVQFRNNRIVRTRPGACDVVVRSCSGVSIDVAQA